MVRNKMRWASLCLSGMMILSVNAYGTTSDNETVTNEGSTPASSETADAVSALEKIDMTGWLYNEEDDVYYQTGISYCGNPADPSYETLAVFVPGAYMNAVDNGDGTYTCELNAENEVNGYTADTAPIVMPD